MPTLNFKFPYFNTHVRFSILIPTPFIQCWQEWHILFFYYAILRQDYLIGAPIRIEADLIRACSSGSLFPRMSLYTLGFIPAAMTLAAHSLPCSYAY